MIARIREWFRVRLWEDDLNDVSRWKALGIGALRVTIHAARSFSRNLVGVQAAGLTMLSLLGLVPLLWLGLGVAKGLGFNETLEEYLAAWQKSEELPAVLREALRNFDLAVKRVSFKALGLLGMVLLGYSGYSLFVTIERAFNHVWKAKRRSWYKRIGSFIGIVVVVPLFVLTAIAVESVLEEGSLVLYMKENVPSLAVMYDAGVRFLPVAVVFIAITLLYKLLPSTRVYWRPAAVAGVLASVVLILVHGLYVRSQVGLALHNEVYAALAALPMLIVYLSLMWTIILAGVQVSFAVQNVNELGPPKDEPEVEYGTHRRLGLALALAACNEDSVELTEFAQSVDVPRPWVDAVVDDLVAAQILHLEEADGEDRVRTARPAAELTMWDVVHAVERHEGDQELQLPPQIEARLRESMAAARVMLQDFGLAKP